jgi:hypothetical protein
LLVVVVVVVLIVLVVGYRGLGRDPRLALELLSMARADRNVRSAAIEAGEPKAGDTPTEDQLELTREMERIDRRNTARLKEIVEDGGWPGRSRVGTWGSDAAWLLVQHATHDLAFQERALELMKAMARSEVDQGDVAMLADRILVQQGKEQIYGSQFTCRKGRQTLSTPLRYPDRVDELRRSVGLSTFAENERRVAKLYGPCPKNDR